MFGVFIPDRFQARYQRNNKRGGLKNLRCFPECGLQHKERGFCGRPVITRIYHNDGDLKPFCWARFIPLESPQSFEVGQVIHTNSILSQERSKKNPLLPWIRGKILTTSDASPFIEEAKIASLKFQSKAAEQGLGQHFDIAFNTELNGWHYGYASNKHSCNSMHCFEVAVFEMQKGFDDINNPESNESIRSTGVSKSSLKCRVIYRSTPFQLFCRRRRRFTLQPTAPTFFEDKKGKIVSSEHFGEKGLHESKSKVNESRAGVIKMETEDSRQSHNGHNQKSKSLKLPSVGSKVNDGVKFSKSRKSLKSKSARKDATMKNEGKKRKAGKSTSANRRRSSSMTVPAISRHVAEVTNSPEKKHPAAKDANTTTAEAIDLLLGLRKPS
mmetsp:Transcript_13069/g.15864  ORF Transcript_13069/g.15864 Transcript_13069/m.15864 type:complete len:384 (-) Transcript_13069:1485-2636(-)